MEDALRIVEKTLPTPAPAISRLGLSSQNYVYCTVHRAENADDPDKIKEIMEALREIANHAPVIVPLHPRTRQKAGDLPAHKNLRFIEPVGYIENLQLIKLASVVMTDSGGIQKEAYMMKRFCITLRDETEWTELTDLAVNFLSGANKNKILEIYHDLKNIQWNAPSGIYGGGNARIRISEMIMRDAASRGL